MLPSPEASILCRPQAADECFASCQRAATGRFDSGSRIRPMASAPGLPPGFHDMVCQSSTPFGSIRRLRAAAFICGVGLTAAAADVFAADAWTWRDVAAEKPIDHAVMVRGPFDDGHRKVQLTGPVAVVTSDGETAHWYTVYAVTAHGDESPRTARVGTRQTPLALGPPAFLLVPARCLRNGEQATESPSGVYEIRPVLDPPPLDGVSETAGPPAYLALPVDYRHHFERINVITADRGLVIASARDLPPGPEMAATADDFGIARLTARGTGRVAVWLPVEPLRMRPQP